jgi:hypothetical protein
MTAHAAKRVRQRGIAPEVVERVLAYGREAFDHHGGVVVYVDRTTRARLRRRGEAAREVDRLAGVYVLVADGAVVTVGHRHRRLRRH